MFFGGLASVPVSALFEGSNPDINAETLSRVYEELDNALSKTKPSFATESMKGDVGRTYP